MRENKRLSYKFRLTLVSFAAFLGLIPIIFIISNSFMGAQEAAARYTSIVTAYNMFGVISGNMHYIDMTFLPSLLSLSAWRQILSEDPTSLRFLWNSLILTIPIVVGQLVIAPLAAYGFERAKSRHREKLFFAYIIIMLLPMQALLVPHFITASLLGINDNYLAIILPAIFAPLGVFIVRQQLKGFNKELIDAAKTDGASEFYILVKIVLPNIRPTLTALAILAFAEAWSIVDQAVIFIRNTYAQPMSVYLAVNPAMDMGIIFALSTLFMIPALIIFIYGQDDLGEGIGYSGRG